jgi:hypothetical protein
MRTAAAVDRLTREARAAVDADAICVTGKAVSQHEPGQQCALIEYSARMRCSLMLWLAWVEKSGHPTVDACVKYLNRAVKQQADQ